MVCLGLEPRAAGWNAQTNPLSYGGTHSDRYLNFIFEFQITFPTFEFRKAVQKYIERNNLYLLSTFSKKTVQKYAAQRFKQVKTNVN